MEASASRSRLFCAVSQGDVAEVKALLSVCPALASAKIRSKTPLHAVCLADDLPDATRVALINLLVSNGADVNQKTRDRMTPLFYACLFGQLETIKTLIANGAPWDISGVQFTWNSPIHEAIDAGQLDVLKLRHSMQPFRD